MWHIVRTLMQRWSHYVCVLLAHVHGADYRPIDPAELDVAFKYITVLRDCVPSMEQLKVRSSADRSFFLRDLSTKDSPATSLLDLLCAQSYISEVRTMGTRDVALLKAFLMVHEVASYFSNAPLFERYQAEVLPAMQGFYAQIGAATLKVRVIAPICSVVWLNR